MDVITPTWVHDAVFYQIFPDRFAISSRVPKPANLEPWDSAPTPQGYKGGDLLGIVEHLDHLVDLGVDAIYFTPIFQSACNHRYHTHDYLRVDPLLGGDAALETLIDACHARGIKVVLDGVFNHASRGFFQFNDILENGPHSPYLDWFYIEDWPLSAYDGRYPANYRSWVDNRALPKFNTDNPEVREFIMQVAEYWLRKGIDGWRLDVPFEITTPGFWQEFRQRVKALNPEAYIVGEVWTNAQEWLAGDQFDAVMNYLFTEAVIAYTAGPRVLHALVEGRGYDPRTPLTASDYAAKIDALLALYPWPVTLAQLNLLSSHDTARFLSIAGEDYGSVRLATLLQFTFPGAPSIYYGDEIGLAGGQEPDSRRSFPWDAPERWDQRILTLHRDLITLRHTHPALRTGTYLPVYADDAVLVFARRLGETTILVATNSSDDLRSVTFTTDLFPEGTILQPLFGSSDLVPVAGGAATLLVPARDGLVLGG